MEKMKESIEKLVLYTMSTIGLEGSKITYEEQGDPIKEMEFLLCVMSGDLGRGKTFNEEMGMAFYLEEKMKGWILEEKDDIFLTNYNFLLVDGLVKYILFYASKNDFVDKALVCSLDNKVQEMNEYIRQNGLIEPLKECIDVYLKIGYLILAMVKLPIME